MSCAESTGSGILAALNSSLHLWHNDLTSDLLLLWSAALLVGPDNHRNLCLLRLGCHISGHLFDSTDGHGIARAVSSCHVLIDSIQMVLTLTRF